MEFRVLGPLEVVDGDTPVPIAGAKRKAVLALLVLRANEVIRSERLIDELWGEQAPRNAAAALHNHISRLRKALGPEVLARREWGYVLRTLAETIDLRRFEQLVLQAEPLPARERAAKLAEALAMWRGPPLADLALEPGLQQEIAHLEELRLTTLERRIDADLEAGRNSELVTELETLIAYNPLREHLRGQLILSLYRAGRQAEALEVYRETRRVLAEELGLEPSQSLRELERAILRQDPSLAVTSPSLPSAPPFEQPPRRTTRHLLLAGLIGVLVLAFGTAAAVALSRSDRPARSAATSTQTRPVVTETSPPRTTAKPPSQTTDASQPTTTSTAAQPAPPPTTTPTTAPTTTAPTRATTTPRKPPTKTYTTPSEPPTTTTTTPTAPKVIRIVDSFASDTINDRIWVPYTLGTGVDITQRNGRLEMTMHAGALPDSVWNAISGTYTTSCNFTGDFDASVDYTLVDWPAANSVVVGINVSFADNVVNLVRKSLSPGQGGAELYAFGAPSGEYREVITADTSGGFRMKRVRGLITAYYRRGGQWVKFASARRAGAVRLEPVIWASGANFAHNEVTVAYDNFSLAFPQTSSPCTGG